jgi:hypothetical protein
MDPVSSRQIRKGKGPDVCFWLWTPVHERQVLANRHSTNLRRLGKHVPRPWRAVEVNQVSESEIGGRMGSGTAGGRSIRFTVHLPLGTMPARLGGESVEDESLFPKIYYSLDESDPDILVLRRQEGSFVAAFSARGATREGIEEAAKEDYRKVIEANAESLGLQGDDDRQKSA